MKFLSREEYHNIVWEEWFLALDRCPFCKDKILKEFLVWEGKFWYILRNFSPYTWDENHLMAIPYEHITSTENLSEEHFLELKEVHKFMAEYFKWREYFSFTRETFGWRSVEHLHMHFLPWKILGRYLRHMLMNQGFPIKQEL